MRYILFIFIVWNSTVYMHSTSSKLNYIYYSVWSYFQFSAHINPTSKLRVFP